ncbi:Uncharacterized protein QTN25_000548 [Entamoeba marina]
MYSIPHHPFVDHVQNTPDIHGHHSSLTRTLFENFQPHPIQPPTKTQRKKHIEMLKPKPSEEPLKSEQKYPKIRVSLSVFDHLRLLQSQQKCKSYCEVVSKLIEFYEENSSARSSEEK